VPKELVGKKISIKVNFDLKPIETISKPVEVTL